MMGAKHIVLRDEVIDKDNLQGSTGVKASTSTNNGSLNATFYKEIEKVLNVLSTLDCSVFNSSLDFSRDHNHIQKITKEIYVKFSPSSIENT